VRCCSKEIFLGLDYGDKTIGVAVSLNGRVATGVTTLRRKDPASLRPSLKELKAILAEYKATHIILGFPKNMDGEENPRCELTMAFKEKLERYFKRPVILWDERLSTRAVSRVYKGNRAGYQASVDTMAAVYILQGFLDYRNNHPSRKARCRESGSEAEFISAERGGLGAEPLLKKEEGMTNEPTQFDEMDEMDDENIIILVDDDGEEMPLQILSSREDEDGMYVLAAEGEDGLVSHFKCTPSGEDEVTFEIIDSDHEDYERVFEMFKEDYETLGIDIEEIDVEED